MKILIFGIPGSGKTLLGKALSKKLNLPLFHLDKYFFEKGWVERNYDDFLKDVESILTTNASWIIDGNAMRSLEMRYKKADVAIYCKLPRALCFYRVLYRWLSTLGQPKKDGPKGSTNTITWKLIKYLWKFPTKYQTQIEELQKAYPKVKILQITSKKQMTDVLLKENIF